MKRPAPLPNLRACQHDKERKRRCCCIHLQARFASSTSRNIRRENIMIGICNGRMEFNRSMCILKFFFSPPVLGFASLLSPPWRPFFFYYLFFFFSTGLGSQRNAVYINLFFRYGSFSLSRTVFFLTCAYTSYFKVIQGLSSRYE